MAAGSFKCLEKGSSDTPWFTALGDDHVSRRYLKQRDRDTDTQTFLHPNLVYKLKASDSICDMIRGYLPPATKMPDSGSDSSSASGPIFSVLRGGAMPGLSLEHTAYGFRRGVPTWLYAAGPPLHAITGVIGHAVSDQGVGAGNTVWHYIDRGVPLSLNSIACLKQLRGGCDPPPLSHPRVPPPGVSQ